MSNLAIRRIPIVLLKFEKSLWIVITHRHWFIETTPLNPGD
jgi:hypothetical protein